MSSGVAVEDLSDAGCPFGGAELAEESALG